ncbi:hypothetical protein CCAX7_52430 [Capsulimonas corticalis]|uniref:ATP synthase subunit b n=1 Tax=Capsulimonas corticalis TaxID=2219043 RepID=A0A402CNU3_9BACT|nr:F0F1 ATP synthase subunit B [Capsulimonas corticalis]BDI33192.1 hypothetical protein CCAX7_52430 [Capsulimonas corticalis]
MNEIIHALGIDWRLIITQILGFLLLLFFLNKVVFTKVFAFLDQRQADIKGTYDQLDADRAAMDRLRGEYEQRLAGIEAEAREKIQAAVKEAQTLRDNLVADAHQQADAILEKGRSDSERERQKAFLEMRQQIVTLAITAAGKVIGESLDPARHTALVDGFIGSVNAGAVIESGRGVSGNSVGDGAGTGTIA